MVIKYTDSFAGTASSTTATGFYAVFFEVGPVCVTRPRVKIGLGIVLWTMILVLDEETDWCAESDTVLNPRLNMHQIFFVSLEIEHALIRITMVIGEIGTYGGSEIALSWPTSAELDLDILC